VAWQTDKGIVLAVRTRRRYRRQQVLLPTLNNIERILPPKPFTRANRRIYAALAVRSPKFTTLISIRCSNSKTIAYNHARLAAPVTGAAELADMLEHIERLRALQAL